jgi:hypothetical protein
VLVIYTDSDETIHRAKHRMLLLDTSTLRTVHTLRLGRCSSVEVPLPVSAEALTLLCQHSQNPQQQSVKPTLAVVTLDVKGGRVTRWFALGGQRRLLLPGYYYEVRTMEVRASTTSECADLHPPASLSHSVDTAGTLPHPDMVFVLSRGRATPPSWEVWGVSSNVTEMPRRIAVLPSTPEPRVGLEPVLCSDVATPSSPRGSPRFLYVEMNRQAPAQLNGQAPAFRNARGADIVVIDVVTGRVIAPADTSK